MAKEPGHPSVLSGALALFACCSSWRSLKWGKQVAFVVVVARLLGSAEIMRKEERSGRYIGAIHQTKAEPQPRTHAHASFEGVMVRTVETEKEKRAREALEATEIAVPLDVRPRRSRPRHRHALTLLSIPSPPQPRSERRTPTPARSASHRCARSSYPSTGTRSRSTWWTGRSPTSAGPATRSTSSTSYPSKRRLPRGNTRQPNPELPSPQPRKP